MSIGEKIIREINDRQLVDVEKWSLGFHTRWKASTPEQLEALVEQHIRELPAGEIERIRRTL